MNCDNGFEIKKTLEIYYANSRWIYVVNEAMKQV